MLDVVGLTKEEIWCAGAECGQFFVSCEQQNVSRPLAMAEIPLAGC